MKDTQEVLTTLEDFRASIFSAGELLELGQLVLGEREELASDTALVTEERRTD